MQIKTMIRMFEHTYKRLMHLTGTKGAEYAEVNGDGSDRLSNFKKGGVDNDIHPYQYWAVLAGKHWTSIRDFINRTARGEPPIASEDIMGRIDDMLLYLMLLKCLIHDTEKRLLPKELEHDPMVAIFDAIRAERKYQDAKYGPCTGSGGHELAAWTIVLESELDEAKKAAMHGGYQNQLGRNSVRAELIQVAAVAIAALEQHGLTELTDAKVPSHEYAAACDTTARRYGAEKCAEPPGASPRRFIPE